MAAALTAIPGSSDVVDRGIVTYSYASKTDLLGVDPALLQSQGAVCGAVAEQMALGALSLAPLSQISVAITGIAGPGGGTEDKPVGLVWFGVARRGHGSRTLERRFGDLGRDQVRHQSVLQALSLLRDEIRAL